MNRAIVGAAIAALIALSGCASQPLIPYDRSAAKENKTIGLLTPAWPSGPSAVLASDVGQSFGLVGALVDAAMRNNREKELTGILATQNLDANALFVSTLTSELEKEGYTVVSVPVTRKGSDLLKTYPAASGAAVDSYLDLSTVIYGYVAAGIGKSAPYRPWASTRVKLVKSSDNSVLMEDTIAYNPIIVVKNVVSLSPNPDYAFDSWSGISADPGKAAAGVSDAVTQSARAIANLMK
jgi:hypothetical protein